MRNKQIVLNENTARADDFLADVQAELIVPISGIAASIKNMGLTPSNKLLAETLKGNMDPLKEAVTGFLSSEENEYIRAERRKPMDVLIHAIKQRVEHLTSVQIQGFARLTDPLLADLWELNPAGSVSMKETAAERIRESFREYVAPDRVKVYLAHQTAAKSIEKLLGALADAGLTHGLGTPGLLVVGLFEFKEKNDKYEVTPRPISYNY